MKPDRLARSTLDICDIAGELQRADEATHDIPGTYPLGAVIGGGIIDVPN